MRTSISNRCERSTAMLMENGTSRKDKEKPVLRSSNLRGVSPSTRERSTGNWKGKVPATARVVPNTTHFV